MLEIEGKNLALIQHIKTEFLFLVETYGFEEEPNQLGSDDAQGGEYHVLRYTNQKLERQLEILLQKNSNYILTTLKKINNSTLPGYYDRSNTVEMKDLDLFCAPSEFEYKNHILYTEESKTQYFSRIAHQFQNGWKGFMLDDQWIDRNAIDDLYPKKGFKGKSGFEKDKLLTSIEHKVKPLEQLQYKIIENTNDEDPFKSLSNKHLVIHNEDKSVYLKFEISYKNQNLFLKQRNATHQEYRLLNLAVFNSNNPETELESTIDMWIEELLNKYG